MPLLYPVLWTHRGCARIFFVNQQRCVIIRDLGKFSIFWLVKTKAYGQTMVINKEINKIMLHWRVLESDVGLWIGESICILKTPKGYTYMHKLGWKFYVASLISMCDCSWDCENLTDFWLTHVISSLQVAQNITTNELTNAVRYSYLKGPDGHFHNPYDHGCRKNCSDFLIKGYQEDVEVMVLPQQNSSFQQNGVNLQMGEISRSPSNLPSSSSSSSAVSSNGTKAHYHQHSSSCIHSNHGHSSNFVVRALGLWLVHLKVYKILKLFSSVAVYWCWMRV